MKNKGITLVELIVASLIMLIMASLMVKGILISWNIMIENKKLSEAAVLTDTIINATQNELNYGKDISVNSSGQITYNKYGSTATLMNDNGKIKFVLNKGTSSEEKYDLLPQGAYNNLTCELKYLNKDANRLELELKILAHGEEVRVMKFFVDPLNSVKPG